MRLVLGRPAASEEDGSADGVRKNNQPRSGRIAIDATLLRKHYKAKGIECQAKIPLFLGWEAMNSFVLLAEGGYAEEEKSLQVSSRNPKAGCIMPRTHLTDAQLQELHDLAAQWGKIIARHTGDDAIHFDLHAREQIAQAASAGLVEGTLQCLRRRQADTLADQQPCPECGQLCPLTYEDRTLHVQGGIDLPYHEPLCHCPDCRRDFFPPPQPTAS